MLFGAERRGALGFYRTSDVGQAFGELGLDHAALLGGVLVVHVWEFRKDGDHSAGHPEFEVLPVSCARPFRQTDGSVKSPPECRLESILHAVIDCCVVADPVA